MHAKRENKTFQLHVPACTHINVNVLKTYASSSSSWPQIHFVAPKFFPRCRERAIFTCTNKIDITKKNYDKKPAI